jgi:hypothetical protein
MVSATVPDPHYLNPTTTSTYQATVSWTNTATGPSLAFPGTAVGWGS